MAITLNVFCSLVQFMIADTPLVRSSLLTERLLVTHTCTQTLVAMLGRPAWPTAIPCMKTRAETRSTGVPAFSCAWSSRLLIVHLGCIKGPAGMCIVVLLVDQGDRLGTGSLPCCSVQFVSSLFHVKKQTLPEDREWWTRRWWFSARTGKTVAITPLLLGTQSTRTRSNLQLLASRCTYTNCARYYS